MILTNNPPAAEDFPCLIVSHREFYLFKKLIMSPVKIRLDQRIGYYFLIGGFIYIFKIILNTKNDWVMDATINEDGEAKIIHATEENSLSLLNNQLGTNFKTTPFQKKQILEKNNPL